MTSQFSYFLFSPETLLDISWSVQVIAFGNQIFINFYAHQTVLPSAKETETVRALCADRQGWGPKCRTRGDKMANTKTSALLLAWNRNINQTMKAITGPRRQIWGYGTTESKGKHRAYIHRGVIREQETGPIRANETGGSKTRLTAHKTWTFKVKQETRDKSPRRKLDTEQHL